MTTLELRPLPVTNDGEIPFLRPQKGVTPIAALDLATKAYVDSVASSASVPDGDKGDVVVSSSGTVWTLDSAVVTTAARTVLDDTTVAAMVNTLGGTASTGSNGLVRETSPTIASPTLTTPVLGTPSSGDLQNCTAATTTTKGVVELALSSETTAGLAVQASDTRLSDARTPTSHTHPYSQLNSVSEIGLLGQPTGDLPAPFLVVPLNSTMEFVSEATLGRAAITGDVTIASGSNASTIANNAVTLAKMATVATDRLLGRDTAGTGNVEALTVGGGVEFTGSTGIQRSALTGDVTASAGSNATTIAANVVTFAKFVQAASTGCSAVGRSANSAGDFAEIKASSDNLPLRRVSNVLGFGTLLATTALTTAATDKLLGRDTAAGGAVEEIAVSGGLEFTGSTGIQRSALTGDVTASAGSNATTIANDAVTFAKMQNSAAAGLSVVGRSTNSAGDFAEINAANDNEVLRRSGTAVGFGAVNLASSSAVTGALAIANGGTGQTAQTAAFDALCPTTTKGDIIVDDNTDAVRLAVGSNGQTLVADTADTKGIAWKHRPISLALVTTNGFITWTDMPAAHTIFMSGLGSTSYIKRIDLTAYSQVRFNVVQSAAAVSGARLRLRYSTTFATSAASFSTIGSSEVDIALDTGGSPINISSSWIDLVAGAKADVWVAVTGVDGNATADPTFFSITVEFR